jgi:uncharacterized membrane protein YesL
MMSLKVNCNKLLCFIVNMQNFTGKELLTLTNQNVCILYSAFETNLVAVFKSSLLVGYMVPRCGLVNTPQNEAFL